MVSLDWYVIGLVKSWLFCHVTTVQGINTLNIWYRCISIYLAQLIHTAQEKLQKPKTSSQKSCGICFDTKYPHSALSMHMHHHHIQDQQLFYYLCQKRKTCANPVIQYISKLTDVSCKETVWILLYGGINRAVLGPVLSVLKYTNA